VLIFTVTEPAKLSKRSTLAKDGESQYDSLLADFFAHDRLNAWIMKLGERFCFRRAQ
jgi:hypothetical protein